MSGLVFLLSEHVKLLVTTISNTSVSTEEASEEVPLKKETHQNHTTSDEVTHTIKGVF